MLKASPTDRSKLSLPDLDLIASRTQLIIRKSHKFSAGKFLQSLLSSVVTGQASLNQIAGELNDKGLASMARQSLHQRFDTRATAFLMAVLSDLTQQRYRATAVALKGSKIQRIIIEDASAQTIPKSNADAFPAHGNHHGKTAGVKIDLAFDLLTGSIISHPPAVEHRSHVRERDHFRKRRSEKGRKIPQNESSPDLYLKTNGMTISLPTKINSFFD